MYYVNAHCNVGPYLNAAQVLDLPYQIGPASINHVFREIMQMFVNVTLSQMCEIVFQCLAPGAGQFIVTGKFIRCVICSIIDFLKIGHT